MREIVSLYLMRLCKMLIEEGSLHFLQILYCISGDVCLRNGCPQRQWNRALFKSIIIGTFGKTLSFLFEVLVDPTCRLLKHEGEEGCQALIEFYQTEYKKLRLQREQIIENYFGITPASKTSIPSFIIKGSKLVFINKEKDKLTKIEEDMT